MKSKYLSAAAALLCVAGLAACGGKGNGSLNLGVQVIGLDRGGLVLQNNGGDDLALDVAGAQAAGLRAVWMNRRGAALPDGAPQPDAICATLDELLAWLEQQLAE